MQSWRERLQALGEVVTFDYRYMRQGRKAPDRLPNLIAAHREALAEARERFSGPVVLIGKSMGGRIGCHVSLEEDARALICLGYPLKGAKGTLRDEVLLSLQAPILFVQGSRDTLCPLDVLERVRSQMSAPSGLHVVDDGNHSLTVSAKFLKSRGQTQEDVDNRVLEAIRAFLEQHVG
jgi:predicted alpha/beta-hydrolase family hydrolase